jgi:hypothetical protein
MIVATNNTAKVHCIGSVTIHPNTSGIIPDEHRGLIEPLVSHGLLSVPGGLQGLRGVKSAKEAPPSMQVVPAQPELPFVAPAPVDDYKLKFRSQHYAICKKFVLACTDPAVLHDLLEGEGRPAVRATIETRLTDLQSGRE